MTFQLEKIIFYALIFCLPLEARHIFYSFSQSFNEWLSLSFFATDFLVLILLWLWLYRAGKKLIDQERRPLSWRQPEIWLAGFLFVSLSSVALADNRWLAVYGWLKLVELAGLFLYVRSNLNKIFNLKIFWQAYVAGAVLQSLVAIAQFFKQQSLGLKWLGESPLSPDIDGVAKIVVGGAKIIRSYGLAPHPNILAAILVVAIFGLTWLFLFGRFEPPESGGESKIKKFFARVCGIGMTKREWAIFGTVFIIILAALFFTFSRSIMVIGFVLWLIWLIVLCKNKNYRKPILGIFLLFAIGYSLLAIRYWPIFANRFSADTLINSQSASLRVHYNEVAMDLIFNNPMLGIGQGNFVNNFSQYYSTLGTWVFQPVHNIYLLIASETGLIGLFIFLFFLALVFSGALRTGRPAAENCFIYIYCFIMLTGLTDHFWWDLQQGQILFWLMLGFLSAHSSMDRA